MFTDNMAKKLMIWLETYHFDLCTCNPACSNLIRNLDSVLNAQHLFYRIIYRPYIQ